jgi:hypothetical protein
MFMKAAGFVLLVVVAFVGGFFTGDRLVTQKMQAQVTKVKGDAEIYRAESEKLSAILREIRQTASQATVVEKAL